MLSAGQFTNSESAFWGAFCRPIHQLCGLPGLMCGIPEAPGRPAIQLALPVCDFSGASGNLALQHDRLLNLPGCSALAAIHCFALRRSLCFFLSISESFLSAVSVAHSQYCSPNRRRHSSLMLKGVLCKMATACYHGGRASAADFEFRVS